MHSREYHYNKPEVEFSDEDKVPAASQLSKTVIKGQEGKSFEVSMAASRKVFETRLPPKEEVFIIQHINQKPLNGAVGHQNQQQHFHPSTFVNSTPNPRIYGNFQQSFNNPQQHLNSNHYNGFNAVTATNNAQNNFNQFSTNSNYQRQQQFNTGASFQQQFGLQSQRALQQQQLSQQPQQQYYPQQYEHYLQQPQRNTNLPNSNNLLNDLVNNQKYVSQSEAAQLDVYPYKQINGNPRPFTRVITKCDASGQCQPQNAAEGGSGGSDFHHQQVLKQSKAQVSPAADKCQTKFNYQFTGNALTNNAAKAQRGIPIYKGTDLKDRRLFAYNEVVIPQYPHN